MLRELHGWDAWNVTEDADLGIRLALAGYHVGDLPSATFEEAPRRVGAWLHQRSRWLKGFAQTSFTHGRAPLRTARRLGALRSLCAFALMPGTFGSALLYPFLTAPAAYDLLTRAADPASDLLAHATRAGAWIVFLGGLAAMLVPPVLGCVRRRWWNLLPWVALLPFYYVLVSAAAWLALFELVRHPHRWNKTEHGLARTSRSGALTITGPARAPSPAGSARG